MNDPTRLLAQTLDPEIRQALEAGATLEPPPDATSSVWSAIAMKLPEIGEGAGGAAGGVLSGAGAPPAGAAGGVGGASVSAAIGGLLPAGAKFGLIGVALGVAVIGGAEAVRIGTEPPASVPSSPAVSNAAPPPAQRLDPVPSAAPSSEAAEVFPERSSAEDGATPAPGALDEPVDALREESRLVAEARRRLRAADPGGALELLAETRARFPRGTLYQERDALEIEALAGVGRRDEAVARARRFLEEHPRSAHAARVSAVLESTAR